MYGPTKPAHWAIIGFVAVTLLVLSGLSWATIASLRLEQKTMELQAIEARSSDLKLALWRIENLVMPVLGREMSRPYHEYTSYYLPQTLHYGGGSEPAVDVLQESPLLDTAALEPWLILHFQYTDYGGWTSPQLPSPHKWSQIEALPAHDPGWREREKLLDRLTASSSTKRFAEEIDNANHRQGRVPGRHLGEAHVKIVSLPGPKSPGDFMQRSVQITRLQELSLPKVLECEPASNILNVVGQQAQDAEEGPDETDGYKVSVGEMTSLWLDFAGSDQRELVFVRRVRADEILAYQGFIVDWRKLATTLLASASVGDLFEEARLDPVYDPAAAGDRANDLVTLPLSLVASIPKAAATTSPRSSTRITITFAWVTAVIALIAVGLGVRGMVSLTARRTEFTYAVTHELRTPLTTFQLYTDMLSSGLVPEEKKAAYLQTLHEESRRLSDLVAEVLEFSRIESNAVRTNPGAHTVGELLDSVRERYASRCAAAGIDLALDANDSSERRFHTDLHIALQIVGTLIDNACKYATAPAGRGAAGAPDPPYVRISAHPGPHDLAIEIADNGPGIAAQDRHDLFKPFRRGSQAPGAKVGGVGLGLALAKRWSKLIRGNLELVDQGPVRGTRFRLTLPAQA